MKEVLLLYSGGKDSLLSACYLISQGYHVYLIHYDNSSEIGTENIQKGAELLEKHFGKDRVTYLVIAPIFPIIHRLKKIENLSFLELASKYGNTTISQYQCLLCRSAMYYYSCVIAKDRNIKYIAEGARKSQLFAIEQEPLMECFRELLKELDLELLTPVYDLDDDEFVKLQLNRYGVYNYRREAMCVLGYPLNEELSESIIAGTVKIFKNIIEPEFNKIISDEKENSAIKFLSKRLDKDYVHWA